MNKALLAVLAVAVIIAAVIIALVYPASTTGPAECASDSDCVLFGKTGECNCGCYHKDNLPKDSGGECFCAAPTSCECIEGKCVSVFAE